MTEPTSVNIQSKLATNRGARDQGAADTEASLGGINQHPPCSGIPRSCGSSAPGGATACRIPGQILSVQ